MKVMLNFSDFVADNLHESEEITEIDESLDEYDENSLLENIGEDYVAEELLEKINVLAIARKANNIEEFKTKIVSTLEKDAPSLAADDSFVEALMKSYKHTDLS